MAPRIPLEIREEILNLWLRAYSRDDIAKIVGVGAGTVSEIVKDYGQRNPGFELLRELVVALKREGSNIREYASAIPLRRVLNINNLSEEQVESLIRNAANHCFKKGIDIQRFIENVTSAADLSSELGIPIVEVPNRIREIKEELGLINRRLLRKKHEISQVSVEFIMINIRLQEFKKRLPTVEKAEWLIDNLTRQRGRCIESCRLVARAVGVGTN
jgi:transcriptional regulator with XRE-family HTH domain